MKSKNDNNLYIKISFSIFIPSTLLLKENLNVITKKVCTKLYKFTAYNNT